MSGEGLGRERTCAVVVTHRPDADFPGRLAGIAGQVDAVVIVDNRSPDDALDMLRGLGATTRGVDLIANADNRGVAAALNQGLAWARARGYAWAVTFDQDTTPTDRLVETLAAVHEDARATKRVAVIGSNYVDDDPGSDARRRRGRGDRGRGWIEAATVLTSGSAVSLAALEAIGPFRDDLFIDHVDHEYCLRARARGYSVILAEAPLMTHRIGAARGYRAWGRVFWTEHHPARRWYFRTRNLVAVVRQHGRRELRWALAAMVWHLRTTALMAWLEDDRMAKLREAGRGAWDGLRGRLGGYRGAPIPAAARTVAK